MLMLPIRRCDTILTGVLTWHVNQADVITYFFDRMEVVFQSKEKKDVYFLCQDHGSYILCTV